jgi:ADP-ribose pyrophosphatase
LNIEESLVLGSIDETERLVEEKTKTLGTLFANHFSAHLDEVQMRTGKLTQRIKIEHPPAAAVVPFKDSEHIVMVRQWRYAIGRETLEIPAGKVDPGEDLETCAHRELEEETGYQARRLLPVFRYYPAIGYSNEVIQIYGAAGLIRVSKRHDEEEIFKLEVVRLDQILDLILKGTIQDGKTVIGICLIEAKQQRGEIPKGFFS